jgi:Bacterial dnaA protein helix-turn-helix
MESDTMVFLSQIDTTVCSFYGLAEGTLQSKRRDRRAAFPRFVAILLARRMTKASYPKLGKYFDRDHSTMLIGHRRGLELEAESLDYAIDIEALRQVIQAKADRVETLAEAAMRITRRPAPPARRPRQVAAASSVAVQS